MYVSVRVVAEAKKESVELLSKGRLAISVKEPAKQNLANRRVVELVAAHFSIPVSHVRIINGHTSPSKLLSIDLPDPTV